MQAHCQGKKKEPSERRRLHLVSGIITMTFMSSTLQHIIEGTRPIDWIMLLIEALVLAIIAWAEIAGCMRRRKEKRTRSLLDARVVEFSKSRHEGKRLLSTVPDANIMNEQVMRPWIDSVGRWIEKTNLALQEHSDRASREFMKGENGENINLAVTSSHHQFFVQGSPLEPYKSLVIRLENLERILERPEVYFSL